MVDRPVPPCRAAHITNAPGKHGGTAGRTVRNVFTPTAAQASPRQAGARPCRRPHRPPPGNREKAAGKRNGKYPDRESNSDLLFRRELFYPLNYQGNTFFSLQRYSKSAEKQKKREFIFEFRPIWCNFVVKTTPKTQTKMQETRQNKVARLLQKELSLIFQGQTRATHGVMVSVTRVRVSPDLSVCTAYISIFPSSRGEEILAAIRANEKTIRYELGTRVRFQLRIVPELRFFIDDSLDYIEHIDELLKQ